MPTEADICRTLITPKLQVAGWENESQFVAVRRHLDLLKVPPIALHGNSAEAIGKIKLLSRLDGAFIRYSKKRCQPPFLQPKRQTDDS